MKGRGARPIALWRGPALLVTCLSRISAYFFGKTLKMTCATETDGRTNGPTNSDLELLTRKLGSYCVFDS